MLLPCLTELVPRYVGEHGLQRVVACNSCFSIILCLFRPLVYPAMVSCLISEHELAYFALCLIICGAQGCEGA